MIYSDAGQFNGEHRHLDSGDGAYEGALVAEQLARKAFPQPPIGLGGELIRL
jgi:hypothetical protein